MKNNNDSLQSHSMLSGTSLPEIGGPAFEWHPASAASQEVFAACAASLVYCDPEVLREHLVLAEEVCMHSVENAFAASWLKEGRWTVAFRGTEVSDWRDFADDVDVRRAPVYWSDCGHAHTGFLRHFQKLQASLLAAALRLPSGACHEVLFVGHSLGGAVALLTATFFTKIWQQRGELEKLEVRTFGAPKVGDGAFYDWCVTHRSKMHIVSYANSADAVPKLPPGFQENWCDRRVSFRSQDPLLEAHSMRRYLLDVILSQNDVDGTA